MRLNASGPLPVQRVRAACDAMAAAVSRLGYPAGAESVLAGTTGFANRPTTEVVIVNPADGGLTLAASVLARSRLGTVLPAGPRGLSPVVRAEFRRPGPVGAVLIGGESAVPDIVRAQLAADGVPLERVSRISGSSAADIAANVARAMDRRPEVRGGIGLPSIGGTSAFDAVVVINPQAPESAAASALAASFRLPVLLVSRDAVPMETRAALTFFDVRRTLVIGGTSAVSYAVATQLPGAVRLAGVGATGTSEATLRESLQRGGPANIVYVADAARPMDAAVLGAAVARAGGLMLLTPGADAGAAERQVTRLGLRDRVDRLVVLTQR